MDKYQLDIDLQKEKLRSLATHLANNLDELKRPLVIEFSGTPKAGKTTCVDAISKFFRRHQIPVYTVTERASICPILDKRSPLFNIWTGSTSLAQLLEALDRRVKIVILDRGLFDTLVWMNLHRTRKLLLPDLYSATEVFFLQWAKQIDIVVGLSVSPETSLEREFKDQITDIQGSIMNLDNLAAYNASLQYCLEKYKDDFRKIIPMDTTGKKPVDGVAAIAFEVLLAADSLADEEIAVVDQDFIRGSMTSSRVIRNGRDVFGFVYDLVKHVKWIRRTEAEDNSLLVQIIPVAVIRRKNEILVMNVRGAKHGRLMNRQTIWAGGHVRKSDVQGEFSWATFRDCLLRELKEELQLPPNPAYISRQPKAIVWDDTQPRSMQHLALFYEYNGELPPGSLHLREYYESGSKSLFTEFRALNQDLSQLTGWESWSVAYLSQVHKIKFPKEDRQALLL